MAPWAEWGLEGGYRRAVVVMGAAGTLGGDGAGMPDSAERD